MHRARSSVVALARVARRAVPPARARPVASILAINNGAPSLDAAHWSSVWFKGGSEPGVVTLNYVATTRTGARSRPRSPWPPPSDITAPSSHQIWPQKSGKTDTGGAESDGKTLPAHLSISYVGIIRAFRA